MSHLNLLNVDPSSQRAACEPAAIDRRMARHHSDALYLFCSVGCCAAPPSAPTRLLRAHCSSRSGPADRTTSWPGGFAFIAGAPTLSRDSRPGYTSGLRWVRTAARRAPSALLRGARAAPEAFFFQTENQIKIKSKSKSKSKSNAKSKRTCCERTHTKRKTERPRSK